MSPAPDPRAPELERIAAAISERQRFVVASHARPDGDAIGSAFAMAYALRAIGKEAVVVSADPAPAPLQVFPGVSDMRVAPSVDRAFDAAIIMECSTLARTGIAGLDRCFVINIDHHPGNSGFGNLQWFDPTAAACGEMVFELVRALGAPLSRDAATHLYLAILTDTGSFHFSSISPRTFDICRQALEAGVDPVFVSRAVYDSNNLASVRLTGSVLNGMQVDATGRIAVLFLDNEMTRVAGGSYDDTEGLINIPLSVKAIQAVVFFKHVDGQEYRISLRSKGTIDVGAIAKQYGGGGHKNAAGCTASGAIESIQALFVEKIQSAIQLQHGRVAELQEGKG